MYKQNKYKPGAVATYNGYCSTRLNSNQLKDFSRRLVKVIENTTDELLKEDITTLLNAIETLRYGLAKEKSELIPIQPKKR